MGHNQELGRRGEDLAARYLERRGMELMDRNWRCGAGELDILARDAGVIAGIEVKSRSGIGYGHPAEAVVGDKLRRLYRLINTWCRENGHGGDPRRIDVVSIVFAQEGPARVEYYPAVEP
jgi:putative endonuclease